MYTERVLLTYIIGGYFFSPVAMNWVRDIGSNYWYMPYVIWSLLIIATLWAAGSKDIDGI